MSAIEEILSSFHHDPARCEHHVAGHDGPCNAEILLADARAELATLRKRCDARMLALLHVQHRTHKHRPDGCDGCKQVEAVLSESEATP